MRSTSKFAALALASGLVVGGFAGFAGPAFADSTTPSPTIAHIGVNSGITLTGLTPSFTIDGAPGATVGLANAVGYNVETNNVAGYIVQVESLSATMTPAIAGNVDSIPIGALTARDGSSGGAYVPLSTAPVTVHTRSSRSANLGDNLTTDYQIRIPVVLTDTYSATLDYVASTL